MRTIYFSIVTTFILAGCSDPDAFYASDDPYSGKAVQNYEMALQILESREKNAPKIGSPAPNPMLKSQTTGKSISLSDFWKEKPAAIVFGSLSCDRTFDEMSGIQSLYSRFGKEYQFVFVYIREAHPANGWKYKPEKYPQVVDPASDEIRINVSRRLRHRHKIDFPVVIDPIDDRAAIAYAAWPTRLYIVDRSGTIQFQGRPGLWIESDGALHTLSGYSAQQVDSAAPSKKTASLEKFLQGEPDLP